MIEICRTCGKEMDPNYDYDKDFGTEGVCPRCGQKAEVEEE